MGEYKIKFVELPADDNTFSSRTLEAGMGIKEAFWDNNLSISCCIAMLLGRSLSEVRISNPHILLYGKYLGGFEFEGYEKLPPLCILNVVSMGVPYNVVYHNGTFYDPKSGVYSTLEYGNKFIKVLSYIQIFMEDAYGQTDWRPEIPAPLKTELGSDEKMEAFFYRLPSMQQSKIINYIHPFSKPSSLKIIRPSSKPLTLNQLEKMINHIRYLYQQQSPNHKNVWEELHEFETVEAVETLKSCGLNEGMTVLDMGCGHGHYSIAASIAAGATGRVFAVDKVRKVIKAASNRAMSLKLSNITFLNTDEKGLGEYISEIDFLIIYDVLHLGEWKEHREDKLKALRSLLKDQGILSLALYSDMERKPDPNANPTPKGFLRTVRISHEEAIKPYLELIEACGFRLQNVVENGGVHFDDFHSSYHWRKFGEVRVSKLERRNIYNFIKQADESQE